MISACVTCAGVLRPPLWAVFTLCLVLGGGPAAGDEDERWSKALAAGETAYDKGDYQRALDLWLPPARAGVAAAEYNVATLLRLGRGGAPDYAGAAQWYLKAAEQGHLRSQVNLGRM